MKHNKYLSVQNHRYAYRGSGANVGSCEFKRNVGQNCVDCYNDIFKYNRQTPIHIGSHYLCFASSHWTLFAADTMGNIRHFTMLVLIIFNLAVDKPPFLSKHVSYPKWKHVDVTPMILSREGVCVWMAVVAPKKDLRRWLWLDSCFIL